MSFSLQWLSRSFVLLSLFLGFCHPQRKGDGLSDVERRQIDELNAHSDPSSLVSLYSTPQIGMTLEISKSGIYAVKAKAYLGSPLKKPRTHSKGGTDFRIVIQSGGKIVQQQDLDDMFEAFVEDERGFCKQFFMEQGDLHLSLPINQETLHAIVTLSPMTEQAKTHTVESKMILKNYIIEACTKKQEMPACQSLLSALPK